MIGPRTGKYAPASSPEGLTAAISFRDDLAPDYVRLSGELLAVGTDHLTVLAGDRVIVIFMSALKEVVFLQDKSVKIKQGQIRPDRLERIRLQSRFPQGMSPDVEGRLLEMVDQPEVLTVR